MIIQMNEMCIYNLQKNNSNANLRINVAFCVCNTHGVRDFTFWSISCNVREGTAFQNKKKCALHLKNFQELSDFCQNMVDSLPFV